jgi:hypothetical protein
MPMFWFQLVCPRHVFQLWLLFWPQSSVDGHGLWRSGLPHRLRSRGGERTKFQWTIFHLSKVLHCWLYDCCELFIVHCWLYIVELYIVDSTVVDSTVVDSTVFESTSVESTSVESTIMNYTLEIWLTQVDSTFFNPLKKPWPLFSAFFLCLPQVRRQRAGPSPPVQVPEVVAATVGVDDACWLYQVLVM